MKIVIQNVLKAECIINEKIYSNIDKGFCLFVSFTDGDDDETVIKMANKILKLRVFADKNGKTNLSLIQIGGSVLSISQFTLYADLKGMNRPSFTKCMKFEEAKKKYELFNDILKEQIPLKTGVFGEDMKINLVNDGPFTIIVDSNEI